MRPGPRFSLFLAALVLLAGCAKHPPAPPEKPRDIYPEAQAYYRAHPEFFSFQTPADLPKDLVWEDGHDVPEFSDPEAKRGGTENDFISDFPRTLRTIGPDANGGFRGYIGNGLGLISRHPVTRQYYPGLAREWAFAPDGRTIYFKLDPDARFSDGVPVTADDFLFVFFYFRSPYTGDPWYVDYYTKTFAHITKYDDHTIAISAPAPRLDLADYLAIGATPEHFYKELGPDYIDRYQWRLEPTTGPYTILLPQDLHKGESVDLTRVKNWWASDKRFYRHRFNVDRIHVQVIRDANKALEAFKRGDLDQFGLNSPDLWHQKLPDSDPLVQQGYIAKVTFYNHIARTPYGLYLNTAMPLLRNRDIRLGLASACNFDLVIRKYYRGEYQRLQTYNDDYADTPFPDLHPLPYSIPAARDHFARAGFTRRGPDGILTDADGTRLSFTITADSGSASAQDVLTILKEEAAKAGVEFKLEILDSNTAWKKVQEKHHQIAYTSFTAGGTYPRYWEYFHSVNANKPDTNNLTNYADPVTDRLIDQYQQALTLADVQRIAPQIEKRIADAAVFIPGIKVPFFRTAFWRWVRFPPDFDLPKASGGDDSSRGWNDDGLKAETLSARSRGTTFPPDLRTYNAPAQAR
jgi:microcin C transport system substrate-binding protein